MLFLFPVASRLFLPACGQHSVFLQQHSRMDTEPTEPEIQVRRRVGPRKCQHPTDQAPVQDTRT